MKTKDTIIANHNMGIGSKHNTFDLSEKYIQYVKQKVKSRAKKIAKVSQKNIRIEAKTRKK